MSEQTRQASEVMTKARELVNAGGRPLIKFNVQIEEGEGYWEKDMIARITKFEIDLHERDMANLTFDETGFEAINDKLASSNYYDKDGKPCLTGKQAGWGPKNGLRSQYLMLWDAPFEFVEDRKTTLIERYKNSPESKIKSYCDWLEDIVISLESMN